MRFNLGYILGLVRLDSHHRFSAAGIAQGEYLRACHSNQARTAQVLARVCRKSCRKFVASSA